MPIDDTTYQNAADKIVTLLTSRYSVTGWYNGTLKDMAQGILEAMAEDSPRVDSGRTLVSASAGRVNFSSPFNSVPAVTINVVNVVSGVYISSQDVSGFNWESTVDIDSQYMNWVAAG